ncbi:hypothetical protein N7494_012550 [Penicillium frequentans]|uniref:Uncharacterized protein n=1 Tax=Penicillium frequentans TaxID=3151616 RepID=A0AAD6CNH4_9EURO|nr:hypothetical protein N7494_012550 [Penicillium glabrum]
MQTNRDLPKDFWQPEKFDWAEEKEDEIRKNEAASAPLTPSSHIDWADDAEEEFLKNEAVATLLTPSVHFDWADDAEEEFLRNEAVATLLTPSVHFDWAEDAEEDFLKNETSLTPSDHCDWAEDKEEEILKNEVALLSSLFVCFSEETHFTVADDTSDTLFEEILTFSCERTARSWEYMQEEVDNEFGSRHEHIHYVDNPHHFNWQGKPVMERSSTRPEESLAVMLAQPKIPRLLPHGADADDWVDRIQAVVCNAFRFIDPVLLILDEVDESILDLRGSALQQASKGHVLKYYTGHGWWMVDGNEVMEDYNLDVGDVGSYLEPSVVVGNGFVDAGGLPTREEWQCFRDSMVAKAGSQRKNKGHRRRDWRPKPSGLRQITTYEHHESAPTIMPILQSPDSCDSDALFECQSTIVSDSDESTTPTSGTSPSSNSSELASLNDSVPAIIYDCAEPRKPKSITSPSTSFSELSFLKDYLPAIVYDCDEPRQPTPANSPSSCSSKSGHLSHCPPTSAYGRDDSKSPTPFRSPIPGLPQAPSSLSRSPMGRQPAIVHGCDYQRKPVQSSQPAVRRKFSPPPQLRSPPGSSTSTGTSKSKTRSPPIAKRVGLVHNNAPSRDPEVYYSFPPAQSRGSKIKKFLKKAAKILLSGLGMPTQPLYSPNCFDRPMD